MHIWGVVRDRPLGLGCLAFRRWSHEVGAWSGAPVPWAPVLFHPSSADQVRKLARLITTITKLYRWKRYGGNPVNRADGASEHVTINAASFRWAWEDERNFTDVEQS